MPWTFDSDEITFDSTIATFDGYEGDNPDPGSAVWPDPSTVALGTLYGPNGDDYIGTLIPGSSGPIGPGGIPVTIPVTSNNQPVDGVAVWITTDAEGTHQIAGTLFTSTFGLANFMLEPGIFYVWVQKAGVNFINPQPIQVLENGTYQWYTG